MSTDRPEARTTPSRPGAPSPRVAAAIAGLGAGVAALSAVLTAMGSYTWQGSVVLWLDEDPWLLGAVLSVTNPLLRPIPLTVITVAFLVWLLWSAGDRPTRLEIVRGGAVAFVGAEILAQLTKLALAEPRPAAVLPGFDTHGYPSEPLGYAFPSAHTAVAVAMLAALWPCTTRTQHAVGVVLVVLIATNRLYVGAHWPLDVLGGAGLGLVAGAVAWLVAYRWPIRQGSVKIRTDRV